MKEVVSFTVCFLQKVLNRYYEVNVEKVMEAVLSQVGSKI